jgi:lipopolysaccharide transport system permease protein
LIIPVSAIVVALVDFLIAFVLLAGLIAWYAFVPSWRMMLLPVFMVWVFMVSIGFGLYVSALNVKYRDFRYVIPFIVQFGLYVSPVGFSSSVVPDKLRLLYSLNPMVGVIDGFRWCVFDGFTLYLPGLAASALITLGMLVVGLKYFRKMEDEFADVI